jgi:hypothetical protein
MSSELKISIAFSIEMVVISRLSTSAVGVNILHDIAIEMSPIIHILVDQ